MLHAIALGVLQGLTEFLPVSSSGHLVLARSVTQVELSHPLAFDVVLHFGTLLAVVLYFRRDLTGMALAVVGSDVERADELRRWVWLLALATVPAAVAGGLGGSTIEAAFSSPPIVGAGLLVTAALLWTAAVRPAAGRGGAEVVARDAVLIGMLQVVGLVPGISRSGSTIVGGLLLGLDREVAARFAFLMSVPAIAGAMVKNAAGVGALLAEDASALLAGMFAAALTGWFAIEIMMRVVRGGRLRGFALYCLVLGGVTLVVSVGCCG